MRLLNEACEERFVAILQSGTSEVGVFRHEARAEF